MKLKKWQWWTVGIAGVLVLGGIGSALGLGGERTDGAAVPTATITTPPADSATPAAKPTRTTATPTKSLATRVWASIKENFPGGIPTSSPLFAVTKIEDMYAGTIRVYVQEDLDKTGRAAMARQVFNMGGSLDNTDLRTVVIRDASGVDSNHYR